MNRVVLVMLVLLPAIRVMAQRHPVHHYTAADGLSHNNVFRMMQDKRGFMWFSTDYGLSCFNGRFFRNYYRKDGLPHSNIMSAASYGDAGKLVCTYGGGLVLMSDTGFHAFPLRSGKIPALTLYALPYNGSIWLIGLDTVFQLYNIRDGMLRKIPLQDRQGKTTTVLKETISRGVLLLATNNGAYRIDPENNIRPLWPGIVRGEVVDIQKGADSTYWIALKDRLLHLSGTGLIQSYPFADRSSISDLLADNEGNIWAGTIGNGLFRIRNGAPENMTGPLGLSKIIINDIFEDNEGSIWVALQGNGIYRISDLDVNIYGTDGGGINAYCNAMEPLNDSEVLITSIGTVSIWRQGLLHMVPMHHIRPEDFIYFAVRYEDKWLIGTPLALYLKDSKPPYNEKLIPTSDGQKAGAISYCKDDRGTIWIGSFGKLYRLTGGRLMQVQDTITQHKRISAISTDRAGNVWFCTRTDIIRYDGRQFRGGIIRVLPGMTGGANDLYADHYNRLWLTAADGLYYWANDTLHAFQGNFGITNSRCNHLIAAHPDKLWVCTVMGIGYIDLKTLHFTHYRPDVYPTEVLSVLPWKGKIFFGLMNGVSVDEATASQTETTPPPLYITGIQENKRLAYPAGRIRLPYRANKLTIEFIGINYRNAERTLYRYRIQNLDEGWHTTANNAIVLSSLPPGDYVFKLCARQNNGPWGREISLGITVTTPFYKTWWARLILLLAGSTALFFSTRWYILRKERKKRRDLTIHNKMAYLKQQALSALINPHFIFNCMNAVQHYLNRHDNDKANGYLADFASLIRMTLEQAQEAFISLEQEIVRIKLYLSLEQLRFGDDLQYSILIDKRVDTAGTYIPNMIVQPYIENAIWHGIMPKKASGHIILQVFPRNEREINIVIEDDGIGIEKARRADINVQKHSYGMRLTAQRLTLLGRLSGQPYSVSITPALSGTTVFPGTRVVISLPAHPAPDISGTRGEDF